MFLENPGRLANSQNIRFFDHTGGVPLKNVFLKTSQENNCVGVFLTKLIKKRLQPYGM